MYLSNTTLINIENSDSTEPIFLTIPDEVAGMRLDLALAHIIPELSRSRLTNWIKSKDVLLNTQECRPRDIVMGGEEVIIYPKLSDETLAFKPENIPISIIYQDEEIMVIDKPSGLTVHPGNGNWSGTLLNGILYHFPENKNIPRAGIVHRLDKDTTGLMVVAKTLLAQNNLVKQLQNHTVSRIYRAIVEGHTLQNGSINKNIGRDLQNRTKMNVLEIGGKEAITHYRTLKHFDNFSYIECKLETGRTHQIRVHFKSIGHPLIGDPVYGSRKINKNTDIADAIFSLNRQALHAFKLTLIHPKTNDLMEFKSPLTEDIKYVLNVLGLPQQDNYDSGIDEDHDWEILYVK